MRIPVHVAGRRRPIATLISAAWIAALVAACAAGSSAGAPAGAPANGGDAYPAGAPAAAASAAPAGPVDNSGGSSAGNGSNAGGNGDQVAVASDARIVRTGSLELEVRDVATALTGGRDAIRSVGGYIGASQQQRSGDSTLATVTYRMPVARWEDTLTAMRALGTVVGEKTDAVEVTAQLVDLDARIRNLRASEVALVGYAEKAPKVSDLLEIQSRLTDTRGEIERLTAQQANLADQAALATLTVSYSVKTVAVTETAKSWDPASEVDRAAAILVGLGQGIVSFGIVFAIVWLPILVVLGVLVLVGIAIVRRLGWRRPTDPPPFVPPAVSPQA
ncbi:MAG TPA: DUF4349 domain-containing protein [Candidatus Limnocylindrales bacterium]|nr:DUF4349 domain-containing protein [Candidatus Limnocylindrales bacterium]